MVMQNQVSDRALCIRDTQNFDSTKVLLSELIYKFVPIPSDKGTVGYYMYLDDEDMGIIKPDQFNSNFVKTTLTNLDEYRAIDDNGGVIVRC
jgi:hypothetical protein